MQEVNPTNFHKVKKQVVLKILLNSMVAFFLVLGTLNILEQDYPHLILDLSLVTIFLFLKKLSKKEKKIEITSAVFISSLFISSFILLFDGGFNATGPIYSIIFPLPTLFLYGERKGIFLTSITAILNILILLIFDGADWFPDYDKELLFRVLIVYVAVSLFTYSFVIAINTLYNSYSQTYKNLQDTTQEYKELALVREKFISIFTHDFRGHVGTLYNMAQLIRLKFSVWDDQRKLTMIAAIEDLSERNMSFCNSMLSWVLVSNGRMPLNLTSNNIYRSVNNTLELLKERISEKNITLEFDNNQQLEWRYDTDMISSVLRNIISNAIKFTPQNGNISIEIEQIENKLNVKICDSGIGINEDQKTKLFRLDEFHSVRGTSNEKGTGLGLILCKEFIEKHKGNIGFENNIPKGTCFYFSIPMQEV